jgi:hypothetical protein
MNECDQTTIRADARSLVNKARAAVFQAPKRRANIVNADGYVVNARAPPFKKLRHGRITTGRLKQFYARLAHGQHGHTHALLLYDFRMRYLKPQGVSPELERFLYGSRSDSYMLNLHKKWAVSSGQWAVRNGRDDERLAFAFAAHCLLPTAYFFHNLFHRRVWVTVLIGDFCGERIEPV